MRSVYILLLLLSPIIVFAQNLSFENYTSEQGLSQHNCISIAQDAEGFMWFGTYDGLNRYDGKQFKLFSTNTEKGKKLPSNSINSLYYDSVHNLLWVGTSSGCSIYSSSRDSIAALSDFFPFAAALDKSSIKKIVSFRENEYWVVSSGNGLWRVNTKSRTIQTYFTSSTDKSNVNDIVQHGEKIIVGLLYNLYELLPEGDLYRPAPLHNGYRFPQIRALASYDNRLWIGTISAGCYYIKSPVEKEENIVKSDIVFGGIESFGTDNNNKLWIGTRGSGIHQYDAATGHTIRVLHNQFDPSTPLSNYGVYIFNDRQGIIWCGLSGGIAKYDPLRYQFTHVNGANSLNGSLLDDAIYRMYRSKNGNLFIGTQNRGIMQWDKSNNAFKYYPGTAVVYEANNVIYDMAEDEKGMIWSATCGGLLKLNTKTDDVKYFPEKKVFQKLNKMYVVIKPEKCDSLLVGTDEGLRFFSLKEMQWADNEGKMAKSTYPAGLSAYKRGSQFYEDAENTLWLCMSGAGLVRYRYLQHEIETIDAVNKLSRNIYYLLADGPVFLLATTAGLIVYDWKNNKIVKQVSLKGIGPSNNCHAVQKDDNGFYWISTNYGICKLNAQYEIVQQYNTGNGLPFRNFNFSSAMKDAEGNLYFGGMGGITYFNPAQLKQNDFSPAPVITEVLVNDKPIAPGQVRSDHALQLDHKQNFLTIHFAVNNFSNEHNSQFSYRLKGLVDNWTSPSTDNSANFTSLPPGKYLFELRSANSDGKWSNSISTLPFIINKAWWQTWWFWSAVVALIAGTSFYFIRRRMQLIRREANLKEKISEAEMMALRAQMNPHFIFNSLNSIREMILNNETKEASHFLGKFARLIRITLDQSGKRFISLRDTIDHLTRYIEMEQVRNSHFTARINADDELDPDETVLLPMLIQPFIENAIWHGTTGKRRNININIDFKKDGENLICMIDDNGIGIGQSVRNKNSGSEVHNSMGIVNIRNRIRLLNEKYGVESSVSIQDKTSLQECEETGTLITLRLPLETSEYAYN